MVQGSHVPMCGVCAYAGGTCGSGCTEAGQVHTLEEQGRATVQNNGIRCRTIHKAVIKLGRGRLIGFGSGTPSDGRQESDEHGH